MLTLPKDPRAVSIAEAVMSDPARQQTLASMCAAFGIGVRTLERVFRREAGLNFESWRRQARLMKGVELLMSGRSVKEAAHRVGYRQPTAFVTLFREVFGTTPKAWVSALRRLS
jgi:AraC-like DNA-binding protein